VKLTTTTPASGTIRGKMTPRHPETPENLTAERRGIGLLCWFWDTGCTKITDSGYGADFIIQKNNIPLAVCEFKERSNRLIRYNTSNMSRKKFYACLSKAQSLGVPFVYLTKFADGYYYYSCADDSEITDEGVWGRTDRGDPFDISRAVGIPAAKFRPLREIPEFINNAPFI
jgi:hypothetical protein